MKKLSMQFVMAVVCIPVFSQTGNTKSVDSLRNLLENETDYIKKVEYCFQLSRATAPTNSELAKKYNNLILEISEKNNYTKGLSLYHLQSTQFIPVREQAEKHLGHARLAMDGFRKCNDTTNYIRAASCLTQGYSIINQIEQTEAVLKEAFAYLGNSKNPAIARLYVSMSDSLRDKNKTKEAIEYLEKALKQFRQDKMTSGIMVCYNRMHLLYKTTGNWKEARKYIQLCLKMSKEEIPESRAILLFTAGETEMELKNYKAALTYMQQALAISKKQNMQSTVAAGSVFIARLYFELKQYEKSIQVAEDALKYTIHTGKEMTQPKLYNLLRDCYFKLGQYDKVKYYNDKLDNALPVANQSNIEQNPNLVKLYKDMAKVEIEHGNHKKAYDYLEKSDSLNTLLLSREKDLLATEAQTKFDVADKNLQLKDLTIAQQKSKLQIANQRAKLYGVSGILIISALILILLGIAYRANRRRNQVLKDKNQVIANALAEKEILLKEIHHRVKNNLQLVISLLNIQARENNNEAIEEFLDKGRGRIISMALIHENLYQTDDIVRVNFQDYLDKLCQAALSGFTDDTKKIALSIEAKGIHFDIQTAIPLGLIINELICNALKYAFNQSGQGKIDIELNQIDKERFHLHFADNGSGISGANDKKSFGTELVSLLTMQLAGTLSVKNENGTAYDILFEDRKAA